MENKYKFDLNPKKLGKDQIARHMDFDGLLEKYQAVQPKKSPAKIRKLVYSGLAAAAAIAALVYFVFIFDNSLETITPQTQIADNSFIYPPFDHFPASVEKGFKVNADEGGIYEYGNGSRLVVPRAAFIDDRGNLVKGEVFIRYKEYQDYIGFFLSGIPMHLDSAGNVYTLEAAGIIEIYAEQDGKRVDISPKNPIEVEMIAEVMLPIGAKPPTYSVYHFDKNKGNWHYQGADNYQLIISDQNLDMASANPRLEQYMDRLRAVDRELQNNLNALEAAYPMPVMPVKPQQRTGDNPTIELDYSDESFEVDNQANADILQKLYEGTIWQISDKNASYDERAFGVSWEGMRIKKLNQTDYLLTLIHSETELELIINPVLLGDDYQQAVAAYDEAMVIFNQKKTERTQGLQEQENQLFEEAEMKRRSIRQAMYDEPGFEDMSSGSSVKQKIIHRFSASQLGIWSCAVKKPGNLQSINANFVDEYGSELNPEFVYLSTEKENVVSRFPVKDGQALISFDPEAKNRLWIVINKEEIALFSPEEFSSLGQEITRHQFKLKIIDNTIQSERDVREVLGH